MIPASGRETNAMASRAVLSLLAGVWLLATGCSEPARAVCGGGPPATWPWLVVVPVGAGDSARFDLLALARGGEALASFEVRNGGQRPGAVTGLRWEYAPLDPGAERETPAFTCTYGPDETPCDDPAGLPACLGRAGVTAPQEPPGALRVRIRFRRLDDRPRSATLTLLGDAAQGPVTLHLDAFAESPRLSMTGRLPGSAGR